MTDGVSIDDDGRVFTDRGDGVFDNDGMLLADGVFDNDGILLGGRVFDNDGILLGD